MNTQELKDNSIKRRERMIKYLELKVEEQDWHGVADAAMDLREIDSAILTLEKLSVR